MANNFWKASTRDKVKNGTLLGAIMGALIVWGDGLYNFILTTIPSNWQTFAGDFSVPIIIIFAGATAGYFIDKY